MVNTEKKGTGGGGNTHICHYWLYRRCDGLAWFVTNVQRYLVRKMSKRVHRYVTPPLHMSKKNENKCPVFQVQSAVHLSGAIFIISCLGVRHFLLKHGNTFWNLDCALSSSGLDYTDKHHTAMANYLHNTRITFSHKFSTSKCIRTYRRQSRAYPVEPLARLWGKALSQGPPSLQRWSNSLLGAASSTWQHSLVLLNALYTFSFPSYKIV